jgi:uncharacterized protein with FMN-binding domain
VRRIALWLSATVAIVVLLFSYHTSTNSHSVARPQPSAQAPGVVGAQPTPRAGASSKAPPPPATGNAPARVVNGTVAQTQWGPVQVQVRIVNDRITDVAALVYPSGSGHDQAINSYALPRLRQEVLSAQSARIDGVSGATVTTGGYKQSLQSALDAAHFGS